MSGIRIGGTTIVPTLGLPIVVYSSNDWGYVAMAGRGTNVELTDKTVNLLDDGANPLLSPDKTKIVLQGNFPGPNGEGQIMWVPVGGGAPTVISPDDAGGPWMIHPSWHPDSTRVVYIHADPAHGFNGSIVAVDLSDPGNEDVLYTPAVIGAPNGFGPYRPTYSPDGTKVAFVLNNESGADQNDAGLYVMDDDGSNVTQLDTWGSGGGATYGFEGSQFCWTQDGRIVYSTWAFGGGSDFQIYIIDADGSNKTLLTTDGTTSVAQCLITDRGLAPSDAFAVISVRDTGTGDVRPYRLELDASGATVLDASHGPDDSEYFRGCYVHEGRIWFIPTRSPFGILASIAMDGTDYTVECTLGTDLDSDQFFNSNGIVFT